MTEPEIYLSLNELFSDIFLRNDLAVGPLTSAKDIEGWDSIRHIEIMIAAEQRFKVKFASADLDQMKNVGDLVRLILSKQMQ